MNNSVAWTDVGGLAMSYYDATNRPMGRLAQQFTLADNFFMGAFGGSFLNHFWLVCACTPTFPGAPDSMKAKVDASGTHLQRKPDSPASATQGAAQLFDGAVTPDGYAVNTTQPPYQPSNVPPTAGSDARFADVAKNPLPPQKEKTIVDTLSAKGVSWAWYAGAWNAALQDGMQDPAVKRTVIYNTASGSP